MFWLWWFLIMGAFLAITFTLIFLIWLSAGMENFSDLDWTDDE